MAAAATAPAQDPKKGVVKGAFARWCFTLFDTPPEFDTVTKCTGEGKKELTLLRYFIYQQESCPGTARIHYQGYLELHEKHRMTGVKALFMGAHGKTVHLDRAFATQQENIDYCSKIEGDGHAKWTIPQMQGGWMGKGGRVAGTSVVRWGTPAPNNDFNENSKSNKKEKAKQSVGDMVALIQTAVKVPTIEELEELFPVVIFHNRKKAEEAIMARLQRTIPDYRKVRGEIYYGSTGTGKSFGVYGKWGRKNVAKLQDPSGKWFQKECAWKPVLLIEEFSGKISVDVMKEILDVYYIEKETKGGFVPAAWTHVVICSNINPRDWWKDAEGRTLITEEDRNAFMNRFDPDDIHEFSGASKRHKRTREEAEEDADDEDSCSMQVAPVAVHLDTDVRRRGAEFPKWMCPDEGAKVLAAFVANVYDPRFCYFAEHAVNEDDGEEVGEDSGITPETSSPVDGGEDAGGDNGGGNNPFVVLMERLADESLSFVSRFGLMGVAV